jgi:glycosyltransferase involved in cell wall biosynthesis
MIKDYDIVCFANDWDGDPLSKKHVMTRLARWNRILWVNSIGNRNPRVSSADLRRVLGKLKAFGEGRRQVAENIHVFSPLVVPFPGSALARRCNKAVLRWSILRECRRLGFRRLMTYTFLPTSADVAGSLGEEAVVYHCTDDFSGFTGTDAKAILEMERRLIEKSDCVIASAESLKRTRGRYNSETHLVTHGVDVEHFRRACAGDVAVPGDIGALPHPVVGFFGLIADWVDLEMIGRLARDRPQWTFAMIGKIDTDVSAVSGLPNVRLLGRKEYAQLPDYARAFDAAILPFRVNALTVASNPLKLREYLAAGLPVVSTDIPEARRLDDHLRVASDYASFLDGLDEAVEREPDGARIARSNMMNSESWDAKVAEISRIVGTTLPRSDPRASRVRATVGAS